MAERNSKTFVNCCICSQIYIEPTVLPCGHCFCWACLDKWLRRQRLCPLCREKVSECFNPIALSGWSDHLDSLALQLPEDEQEERRASKRQREEDEKSKPSKRSRFEKIFGQNQICLCHDVFGFGLLNHIQHFLNEELPHAVQAHSENSELEIFDEPSLGVLDEPDYNPVEDVEMEDLEMEVSDSDSGVVVEVCDNAAGFNGVAVEVNQNAEEVSDIVVDISDNAEEFRDIVVEVSANAEEVSDIVVKVSDNAEEVRDIVVEVNDYAEENSIVLEVIEQETSVSLNSSPNTFLQNQFGNCDVAQWRYNDNKYVLKSNTASQVRLYQPLDVITSTWRGLMTLTSKMKKAISRGGPSNLLE